MHPGTRAHLFSIGLITIGFAVVDLLWLPHSSVVFSMRNWIEAAEIVLLLAFGSGAVALVTRRLAIDQSRIANLIRYVAEALRILLISAAAFIPLGIATTLFMYMASASQRPLADGWLAQIDQAMGFNWPA
jgi:hypothetical protein